MHCKGSRLSCKINVSFLGCGQVDVLGFIYKIEALESTMIFVMPVVNFERKNIYSNTSEISVF